MGDPDGFGRYGVLDEDQDGLLCAECGRRFTHLGLHVYRAHGVTADQYRREHGLRSAGLVAQSVRQVQAANARATADRRPGFAARRDPAAATAARLAMGSQISPAGKAAIAERAATRKRRARRVVVLTCPWCGVQFCPLQQVARRRFCSRSCASRAARAAVKDRA